MSNPLTKSYQWLEEKLYPAQWAVKLILLAVIGISFYFIFAKGKNTLRTLWTVYLIHP